MATARGLPLVLRTASLAMHRQTKACLARSGFTADRFVLPGLLAREDAVTQRDPVRRASSDRKRFRAMVVVLENRGLVTRVSHPTDGRARRVTLTERGRRLHGRQLVDTDPLRIRSRARFRPQEMRALVDFLARISEAPSPPRRGPRKEGERRSG